MRRLYFVLSFTTIVLVLIAGCSSTQNTVSNRSESQTPTPTFNSAKTTSVSSQSLSTECYLPTPDPMRFKKFLPSVIGYNADSHNEIDYPFPASYNISKNNITDHLLYQPYSRYDDPVTYRVQLDISDLGPCVNESTGYNAWLRNTNYFKTLSTTGDIVEQKEVFYQGYPAVRYYRTGIGPVESLIIFVNNRVSVGMNFGSSQGQYSHSVADTDLEKFANAIDLNGIAMMENSGAAINNPSITSTPIMNRIIAVTAQSNKDGMITITNYGGQDSGDLLFITLSINGADVPTKLGSKTGSVTTVQSTAGSRNHVIAIGSFKDGTHQVVLDTYV